MTLFDYIAVKLTGTADKLIHILAIQPAITFSISVTAVLMPLVYPIIALFISVFLDFITGIMKAHKINKARGSKIRAVRSKRMLDTLIKLMLYSSVMLLSLLIELATFDYFAITKIICGFILTTELISIIENIEKITGEKIGLVTIITNIRDKFIKKSKDDTI
jgi:phage-related holin